MFGGVHHHSLLVAERAAFMRWRATRWQRVREITRLSGGGREGASGFAEVKSSRRRMTPKVRVFVDFLRLQFGQYLVAETVQNKRRAVRRPT